MLALISPRLYFLIPVWCVCVLSVGAYLKNTKITEKHNTTKKKNPRSCCMCANVLFSTPLSNTYSTYASVPTWACHSPLSTAGCAPQAQCHRRISSHMIMWGISMIGCHWFHWHLSPQWDKLQHELLKTYTCRSVSWLRQTIHFATLQRAEESHVDSCFNPFCQSVPIFQARELSGVS